MPRLSEHGRGRHSKIIARNVRASSGSARTAQYTRAERLFQVADHNVGVEGVTQNRVVHAGCLQCPFRRPMNLDAVICLRCRTRSGEAGVNETAYASALGALNRVQILARAD